MRQEFESWQEEEFEKALMDLNLDDIVASSNTKESAACGTVDTVSGNRDTQTSQEKHDADDLSDEALLQAIVDNPELFP